MAWNDEKERLVEEGLLSRSESVGLILYNYTDLCTFKRAWTADTLSARGTIYNKETGEIVARAFDKFFNLGEPLAQVADLPSGMPDVDEKMDGSLGILYQGLATGYWFVATRGSFRSDQAMEAMIMLKDVVSSGSAEDIAIPRYKMQYWPKGWTPLVEIIYPENRIIVDYGKQRKLVLLTARNIADGSYMYRDALDIYAAAVGFERPKRAADTLDELIERAKTLPANEEGWVLSYPNGFRVKVKGVRYLELARFKANLGPLSIWEKMKEGAAALAEFEAAVPEEFRTEVDSIVNRLMCQFDELAHPAMMTVVELDLSSNEGQSKEWFKEKASLIKKQPEWMHGYLYQTMRGSDKAGGALLELLRPKANQYVDVQTITGGTK